LLATQLLAALRAVHARGIAHVDVKPDNVLLRDGRAMLLDFGSARPIGAEQPPDLLIGSPGYAAPELEAGAPIGAATDVYGLGATLYEMLAGAPAFDTETPAAERAQPARLADSPLAAAVLGLLEPDPALRPDLTTALSSFGEICMAAGRAPWPMWARL
jgi:serine/threonine protein kinase